VQEVNKFSKSNCRLLLLTWQSGQDLLLLISKYKLVRVLCISILNFVIAYGMKETYAVLVGMIFTGIVVSLLLVI